MVPASHGWHMQIQIIPGYPGVTVAYYPQYKVWPAAALWPEPWQLACHVENPRCGLQLVLRCHSGFHGLPGPTTIQCDMFDNLPRWHLQVVTTNINYAGTPVTETYVLNQCNTAQPVSSQGPPGAKQFQIPLTAVGVIIPFVQAYLVRVQRCGCTPA